MLYFQIYIYCSNCPKATPGKDTCLAFSFFKVCQSHTFLFYFVCCCKKSIHFSALLCYCITIRFIKLKYSYFGKRCLVFGWVLNTTGVFCLEIYFEICWKFFTVPLQSTCKSLSSLLSILFQKSGFFFINLNNSNSFMSIKSYNIWICYFRSYLGSSYKHLILNSMPFIDLI